MRSRHLLLLAFLSSCQALTLVMMGARRGKGGLKQNLEDAKTFSSKGVKALNGGRGQEITGVTLPAEGALSSLCIIIWRSTRVCIYVLIVIGNQLLFLTFGLPEREGTIKGWEFGGGVQIACTNVGGELFAVQGDCPRCAFDLFKGDLITDSVAWDDIPRVACPTCSTTYGFRTGKHGPPLKRTGLSAFVGNLAMAATKGEEYKDARVFKITRDDEGRVFCRDLM